MFAINFVGALFALIFSVINLVNIYKINKWIEKNNLDDESKVDPSV